MKVNLSAEVLLGWSGLLIWLMAAVTTTDPGGLCLYLIKRIVKQANSLVRQYLLRRRKHWGAFLKCCTTMRLNLCLKPCLFVFSFLVWLHDVSLKNVEEAAGPDEEREIKKKMTSELQTTCTHSPPLQYLTHLLFSMADFKQAARK